MSFVVTMAIENSTITKLVRFFVVVVLCADVCDPMRGKVNKRGDPMRGKVNKRGDPMRGKVNKRGDPMILTRQHVANEYE